MNFDCLSSLPMLVDEWAFGMRVPLLFRHVLVQDIALSENCLTIGHLIGCLMLLIRSFSENFSHYTLLSDDFSLFPLNFSRNVQTNFLIHLKDLLPDDISHLLQPLALLLALYFAACFCFSEQVWERVSINATSLKVLPLSVLIFEQLLSIQDDMLQRREHLAIAWAQIWFRLFLWRYILCRMLGCIVAGRLLNGAVWLIFKSGAISNTIGKGAGRLWRPSK